MAKITFTFDNGDTAELFGDEEKARFLHTHALALQGFKEREEVRAPKYDHGQAKMRVAPSHLNPAPQAKRMRGHL